MKNIKILSGLILIIFFCIGIQSEAADKPAPEELNSFTFYYPNGTKINFYDIRQQLINCIYPPKACRSEYETSQEFEERKQKCPPCNECNCDNVTSLKDIYFLIPVASMKYDADNFKFIIVAGAGYKIFASKSRLEPVHILEPKHDNTKLHEEIEAFIGANPSDRTDYVNRFAESPYIYKRTYVDSFTREYFTNAILDTRHDGIGSGNEVIYSIRFEADSPIEKARRLDTMADQLVFMIRGDMIYENTKNISDLTRIKNVFYIKKIALFNLATEEAIISATP
jgi:hypothetical protein